MATIKSHTDLEQSKKLAEILPLETADMFYADIFVDGNHKYNLHPLESYGFKTFEDTKLKTSKHLGFIPCWSLSALLGVLNFPSLRYDIEDGEGGWIVSCEKNGKGYLSYYRDNPVDTCYEMILKLHKLKLL